MLLAIALVCCSEISFQSSTIVLLNPAYTMAFKCSRPRCQSQTRDVCANCDLCFCAEHSIDAIDVAGMPTTKCPMCMEDLLEARRSESPRQQTPDDARNVPLDIYGQPALIAYICGECNHFVLGGEQHREDLTCPHCLLNVSHNVTLFYCNVTVENFYCHQCKAWVPFHFYQSHMESEWHWRNSSCC